MLSGASLQPKGSFKRLSWCAKVGLFLQHFLAGKETERYFRSSESREGLSPQRGHKKNREIKGRTEKRGEKEVEEGSGENGLLAFKG